LSGLLGTLVVIGLFRRLRGLEASHQASSQTLTCPTCGAVGLDERGAAGAEVNPVFEIRGQDRGKPVRKCRSCGGGFLIRGRRTDPIPSDRWRQMEALFAEHERAFEERLAALTQPREETSRE
jgi:hypothetical protein